MRHAPERRLAIQTRARRPARMAWVAKAGQSNKPTFAPPAPTTRRYSAASTLSARSGASARGEPRSDAVGKQPAARHSMTRPEIRPTESPDPPISDPNSSRARNDGAANSAAPVKISSPAAATGAALKMTLESLSAMLDPRTASGPPSKAGFPAANPDRNSRPEAPSPELRHDVAFL